MLDCNVIKEECGFKTKRIEKMLNYWKKRKTRLRASADWLYLFFFLSWYQFWFIVEYNRLIRVRLRNTLLLWPGRTEKKLDALVLSLVRPDQQCREVVWFICWFKVRRWSSESKQNIYHLIKCKRIFLFEESEWDRTILYCGGVVDELKCVCACVIQATLSENTKYNTFCLDFSDKFFCMKNKHWIYIECIM